jgi:spermidine synthase
MLTELNKSSLLSPKVKVINADAFSWIRSQNEKYDFIIIDFPDPSNYSVGKLYSNSFYRLVRSILSEDGMIVVQSTSPFVAPKSFWSVNKTLESVGFFTTPYHNYVPSFGDWGYIMAATKPGYKVPEHFPEKVKFLTKEGIAQMLYFPKDMQKQDAEVNKLNNQVLVKYFEQEWGSVSYQ